MACVSDDKTNVILLGKLDGCSNVAARRDVDRVAHVVTEDTCLRLWCERIAALVGKVGLHHR